MRGREGLGVVEGKTYAQPNPHAAVSSPSPSSDYPSPAGVRVRRPQIGGRCVYPAVSPHPHIQT